MKTNSVLRSFQHAWRGLRLAFRTERSFRIQTAASLIVLALIFAIPLATWERVSLLVVTMPVLVLELINSSVERLIDLIKPRLSEYAGDIKDLMAGAVFLASLFALLIGILLLAPHVITLLGLV